MKMKKCTAVIGVDPGISGGVAIVSRGGLFDGRRMPTFKHRGKSVVDAEELHDWFTEVKLHDNFDEVVAVIEQVGGRPGQSAVATFTFGRATGAVEAVAQIHSQRVEWVTPAAWKKHFKLSSNKQESLDAARLRFGSGSVDWSIKANDGIAEAALIASYWLDKSG